MKFLQCNDILQNKRTDPSVMINLTIFKVWRNWHINFHNLQSSWWSGTRWRRVLPHVSKARMAAWWYLTALQQTMKRSLIFVMSTIFLKNFCTKRESSSLFAKCLSTSNLIYRDYTIHRLSSDTKMSCRLSIPPWLQMERNFKPDFLWAEFGASIRLRQR